MEPDSPLESNLSNDSLAVHRSCITFEARSEKALQLLPGSLGSLFWGKLDTRCEVQLPCVDGAGETVPGLFC